MTARVGVVAVPGLELRARRRRGGRATSAATPSSSGTATATVARRRRGRRARRVRPRRLPAPRRHRPLLAGDGRGRRASPPPAGPVVGICNGFQVLTEAGLLPGRAAEEPRACKFLCTTVELRVETTDSVLTAEAAVGRRAAHPDQPLRGQLHLRRRDAAPRSGPRTASCCATSTTPTARRRHRRHLQRGPATSSASCPTPSGPSHALLGSTDGAVLLHSLLAAAAAADGRAERGQRQPRLMPAFLSTLGGTPSSRHAA